MQLLFKNKFLLVILICSLLFAFYFLIKHDFFQNTSANSEDTQKTFLEDLNTILDITDCGDSIGSLNGVIVYFNSGGIMSCDGERNLSVNGY